ncbi:MAG: hypothetical protein U1C71_01915, partial [archaeon]|nr:hypothetical protein [archaeon]
TNTRRAIRDAAFLGQRAKGAQFRTVRPPMWRRKSIRLQLAHHRNVQNFLTRSTDNLILAREKVINGEVDPRHINEFNKSVKAGYMYNSVVRKVLGAGAGGMVFVTKMVSEGGGIPALIVGGGFSGLFAAGFLSTIPSARRARLFKVLRREIYVQRDGETFHRNKKSHNERVVDAVIRELSELQQENERQMNIVQSQLEHAKK